MTGPTHEQAYEAAARALVSDHLTGWERTAVDAVLALFSQPSPSDLRSFVLDEVNGMIDSLDETVTQEDMGRVLLELRDAVRDEFAPNASPPPSSTSTRG